MSPLRGARRELGAEAASKGVSTAEGAAVSRDPPTDHFPDFLKLKAIVLHTWSGVEVQVYAG